VTTVGVSVGVGVCVVLGVTLGDTLGVLLGVALAVLVSVGLALGVALGVWVALALDVGVGLDVGVRVGLALGVALEVDVGVALGVALRVRVGDAVAVSVGVLLGVAVGASGAPSQPPAQVSAMSKTALLQPEATHRVAHDSEFISASTQNDAPEQVRQAQHIASAGAALSTPTTSPPSSIDPVARARSRHRALLRLDRSRIAFTPRACRSLPGPARSRIWLTEGTQSSDARPLSRPS
jgi:hypothetical protein